MPEDSKQVEDNILRAALQETATTLIGSVNAYIELINSIEDHAEKEDWKKFADAALDLGLVASQIMVTSLGLYEEFQKELDEKIWPPYSIFPIVGAISSSCFLIKESPDYATLKNTPLSSPKLIVDMLDQPEIETWLTNCFE